MSSIGSWIHSEIQFMTYSWKFSKLLNLHGFVESDASSGLFNYGHTGTTNGHPTPNSWKGKILRLVVSWSPPCRTWYYKGIILSHKGQNGSYITVGHSTGLGVVPQRSDSNHFNLRHSGGIIGWPARLRIVARIRTSHPKTMSITVPRFSHRRRSEWGAGRG